MCRPLHCLGIPRAAFETALYGGKRHVCFWGRPLGDLHRCFSHPRLGCRGSDRLSAHSACSTTPIRISAFMLVSEVAHCLQALHGHISLINTPLPETWWVHYRSKRNLLAFRSHRRRMIACPIKSSIQEKSRRHYSPSQLVLDSADNTLMPRGGCRIIEMYASGELPTTARTFRPVRAPEEAPEAIRDLVKGCLQIRAADRPTAEAAHAILEECAHPYRQQAGTG